MTAFLFICFVAILSTASSYYLDNFEVNLENQWESFKLTYGRTFVSEKVENARKEIFKMNLKNILIHNIRYSRGQESFTMEVNRFTDMTTQEFRNTMLSMRIPKNLQRNGTTYLSPLSLSDLPTEVDWRTKGLVTPIKNQGHCGSCWAFSAIGSIEGQHARKTGTLVSLSAQNLVDCSGNFGNSGCRGGLMENAFDYVVANGGIDTEESYPYVAKDQKCEYSKEGIGAKITGYVDLPEDEKKLTEAVATVGPISVGIDAGHTSFHSYKSGIYEEPDCGSLLNHGVVVVGYGSENGKDYWIIKNSWGDDWGEAGFMRIVRNKNHCGINTLASYPTV